MRKFTSLFLLLCLSLTVSAQWSNDIIYNNQVTEFGRSLYDVSVKTNNDVTYVFYLAPQDGNIVSYLQILDEEGNPTIDGWGLVVSNKITRTYTMVNEYLHIDKDGNAIIVVSDCRNSTEDEKALGYAIYKVSPEGEMLWGEDGVDLYKGMSSSLVASMKIAELEDGSYMFAWMEVIGYDSTGSELCGIRAERLMNDGTFAWDETLTINSSTQNNMYPYLESAGNNQAVLVYTQGSASTVYARKIDFDGTSVWGTDTKVYNAGFNSTIPAYTQLLTKSDPNGGVFVGWYADPEYDDYESAYVAYVKPDGTLAFDATSAGTKLSYNNDYMRSLSFDFVYNEDEDCIYGVWRGVASSQSYQCLSIQKLSMAGELMWGSDGKYVVGIAIQSFGNLSIQNAEDGNFTVFYSDFVESYGDTDLIAIKYDSEGNALWDGGIFEFSPTDGNKGSMEISELINGEYWLASWEEDRIMDDTSDNVSYAQKIYLNGTGDGTDGIATTTTETTTFAAKTSNGVAYFATNFSSEEPITITIYAVTGETMGVAYSGAVAAGNSTVSYSTAHLAPGVYIASLASSNSTASTRMVIK